MEQVIEGLKANKQKAQEIISKAEEHHDKMISAIPGEAKEKIKGLKDQNYQSLKELEKTLTEENAEKEAELNQETQKIVDNLEKIQNEHLDEIADILYQKVVSVPE